MKTKKFLTLGLTVSGLVGFTVLTCHLLLCLHLFSSSFTVQNVVCISPLHVTLPVKSDGVEMKLWFLL
jgi:hypothetical protein